MSNKPYERGQAAEWRPAPASQFPVLWTPSLVLRVPAPVDAATLMRFYDENRAHLGSFEATRAPEFYTERYWQTRVQHFRQEAERGLALRWVLAHREQPRTVIGTASLMDITRGAFMRCFVGVAIAESAQGRGLMSQALRAVLAHAFEDLSLHRVEAYYMPSNTRSAALFRRHGFRVEGIARGYMRIGGRWRDHVATSLLRSDWEQRRATDGPPGTAGR